MAEGDDNAEATPETNLDDEEAKRVEETHGGFKNELERQARDEQEAQKRKKKLDETLDEELELSTTDVFSRSQLLTWLKRRARSMQGE